MNKTTPTQLSARKRAQLVFYKRHKKRLLAYANAYYAEHKEEVLQKAKIRYAKKRRAYYCCVCGKKLPAELSGHHLYCDKCRIAKKIRTAAKKK